jgi:hypothetical protein
MFLPLTIDAHFKQSMSNVQLNIDTFIFQWKKLPTFRLFSMHLSDAQTRWNFSIRSAVRIACLFKNLAIQLSVENQNREY